MKLRSISTVDEFDFGRLFDGSVPAFEQGTVVWPDDVEDKSAWMREGIQRALGAACAFGVVASVDGEDRIALFGRLVGDDAYLDMTLIAPDAQGSKSYCMIPGFGAAMYNKLCVLLGCTRVLSLLPDSSPLVETMAQRRAGVFSEPTDIEGFSRVVVWELSL